MMTEESAFDQAWAQWCQSLTDAVMASPALVPSLRQALHAVGAFDPADGQVRRDWALGLLTGDAAARRPLAAHGVSEVAIDGLIDLIRRHPVPAAGG